MKLEETKWRDLYEFDTPVVCSLPLLRDQITDIDFKQIHINSSKEGEELPELASKVKKLMHRFSPEEVKEKMGAVENEDA